MLCRPCFLLTSEPETCSAVLRWLKSTTSSSTPDSLLIFAEQDPGLPSLHPTGACWGLTTTQQWAVFLKGGQPSMAFSMTTCGGTGPAHVHGVSGGDRNSPQHLIWEVLLALFCTANCWADDLFFGSPTTWSALFSAAVKTHSQVGLFFLFLVSLFSGLCSFLNPPSSLKYVHWPYFLPCCLSPTSFPLRFPWQLFIIPFCCWFKGFHRRQRGSPCTAILSLKAALVADVRLTVSMGKPDHRAGCCWAAPLEQLGTVPSTPLGLHTASCACTGAPPVIYGMLLLSQVYRHGINISFRL